ncbi:hypothetical protein VI817_002093 [Penicillium citrinum]|nr:hypothetical protein VI817_002093 [Penicillium citrinum]
MTCSNEPSKCTYPESGKRGLPLGYLSQLEQRLLETETALYGALVTLRSMQPTTVAQVSAKPESTQKQKAARMDEWAQLPLQGWPDMERWMMSMCGQFTIEQPRGLPLPGPRTQIPPVSPNHGDSYSPGMVTSTGYAWQSQEDITMNSPYETHPHPLAMMSSPVYSRHHGVGGSDDISSPAERISDHTPVGASEDRAEANAATPAVKAEALSKNQPSIYF